MHVSLAPHPSHPCESIDSFDVFVEREASGVTLRYRISGDTNEILLPEHRAPERQDRLWEHTCFEMFARSSSSTRYCELNFSPSTCWAAYQFDDYRVGMKDLGYPSTPKIHLTRDSGHLLLTVNVDYEAIAAAARDDYRVALAAVVEHRNGGKSYWALAHPSVKPDFHHTDAFALVTPFGVAR